MILAHGALVFVAFLAGTLPAAGGAATPGRNESFLLDLVNGERTARGLQPLAWEPTLARLARDHAADMRSMGRATHHSSRDGGTFPDRLAGTDLRVRMAAENVALDRDVRSAHRGLMASPGHRANILNGELDSMGIGLARDDEGSVYVVEDFAARIVRLTDEQAARAIRDAIRSDPSGCCGTGFEEVERLSERMAGALERLIGSDSVNLDGIALDGPSWIYSYTTMDPARLPAQVARRLPQARSYGMAVSFARSRSYPFGTYWVVVALVRGP